MDALHGTTRHTGPAVDPPDASEMVKRIGKLRWLGMQKEAEELHMMLRCVPHTDCVVVIPRDTD
jgi:hypothetical protein